jgi:hypothetical protein
MRREPTRTPKGLPHAGEPLVRRANLSFQLAVDTRCPCILRRTRGVFLRNLREAEWFSSRVMAESARGASQRARRRSLAPASRRRSASHVVTGRGAWLWCSPGLRAARAACRTSSPGPRDRTSFPAPFFTDRFHNTPWRRSLTLGIAFFLAFSIIGHRRGIYRRRPAVWVLAPSRWRFSCRPRFRSPSS